MGPGSDSETRLEEGNPLTPRQALVLVEDERDRVTRSLQVNVAAILSAWGVAWLVGFGLAYFASTRHPAVSWLVAGPVIGVLSLAAAVTSFGQPIRRARGIEGASRQVTIMYMLAWPLAFGALAVLNAGLAHEGMPQRLMSLVWSASAAVTVGVLYLGIGALHRDRISYGLGAWMLVTGSASVFAGHPGNFAVLSLAGGGGFLIAAAPYAWGRRRAAR